MAAQVDAECDTDELAELPTEAIELEPGEENAQIEEQ